MKKKIVKFKTMEEQELYFLNFFYNLPPGERLRALADLQIKNRDSTPIPVKKITIRKHHLDL
jgi:hypothetical protein